jgi:hypothetical protein
MLQHDTAALRPPRARTPPGDRARAGAVAPRAAVTHTQSRGPAQTAQRRAPQRAAAPVRPWQAARRARARGLRDGRAGPGRARPEGRPSLPARWQTTGGAVRRCGRAVRRPRVGGGPAVAWLRSGFGGLDASERFPRVFGGCWIVVLAGRGSEPQPARPRQRRRRGARARGGVWNEQ